MPTHLIRSALLIVLVALVHQPQMVLAQENVETCSLTPVELPLFDATPAAEVPGALATPATTDDPARNATEEEIAEFVAAFELLMVCANSGDQKLANAIFTERFLAARFADSSVLYQPDFERILDQNFGVEENADSLFAEEIAEVKVRDDGRMSARVTFSSADLLWRDTLILKYVGDVWLIDEVILDSR